ncbi:MAG: hypothetical protein ACUVUD_02515 [bacterium]
MSKGLILSVFLFSAVIFNFRCNSGLSPEKPQIFARRDSGAIGDTVIIRVYTVDPEDQLVTYWIEWGDTTKPRWSYFFPSGETIERTHVYLAPGVYSIRSKVRDIDRNESPWSDTLKMKITDRLSR